MMAKPKIKVIIADDEPLMRSNLAEALRSRGIDVPAQVGAVNAVYETVLKHRPCILLLDLKWYGDSQKAINAIRDIRSTFHDVKIIAMTAWPKLREAAAQAGAIDAVEKGFSVEQIVNLIKDHSSEHVEPSRSTPSGLRTIDLFSLILLFFATATGFFVLKEQVASIQQFALIVVPSFFVWVVLIIMLGRSRAWIGQSFTYKLLSKCISFFQGLFKM